LDFFSANMASDTDDSGQLASMILMDKDELLNTIRRILELLEGLLLKIV